MSDHGSVKQKLNLSGSHRKRSSALNLDNLKNKVLSADENTVPMPDGIMQDDGWQNDKPQSCVIDITEVQNSMRPSDPFFSDRFVGPYPTSGSRKGQAANAVHDMLFNTELIKSTLDSGIKAGGGTNEHRRQASNEDLDVIRLANQLNG